MFESLLLFSTIALISIVLPVSAHADEGRRSIEFAGDLTADSDSHVNQSDRGLELDANRGHPVQVAQAEPKVDRGRGLDDNGIRTPRALGDGTESRLEEIIVTAQKRTEKLQDVPVSVQVISSRTLAEQNHITLIDLSQIVPAVHIAGSRGSGWNGSLFIRGVGSGDNPTFDQSVATFVDDIYRGRSRASEAAFLDLDHVEVLKGPQSTFFGNNAIAGALNIVTKKPGDHFEAWARALYGMFGQYAAEGAVGGPITDTFGARLAVTRSGFDRGWLENVNTGQHVPRINNLAGRLTLAFNPNEDLDATLKIEGSQHRTSGTYLDVPNQWINCPSPAPYPSDFSDGGACAMALALNAAVPGTVPIGLNNNKTTGLAGQANSLSTFEDVLTIDYHKWGHTFTSVSGFYSYHSDSQADVVNLPVYLTTTDFPEKFHQFSEELRVVSRSDQAIEYLLGGYFQTDHISSLGQAHANDLNFVASLGPPFDQLAPYLPLAVGNGFTQGEQVYSIFGSTSWKVTDGLKLNAGLRRSWVKKDITAQAFIGTSTQIYSGAIPDPPSIAAIWTAIGLPPPLVEHIRPSAQAWMPSAGIQYQIAPEAMVYFSYSRGFKAGGFDGTSALTATAAENQPYGPEHVNAYELGVKSKWINDRLLLNLDVFRSDYAGLQVSSAVYIPFLKSYGQFVQNAAASRSQGVEFEGQWVISRDFRLGTNVTYLDSYYVSYQSAAPTTLQGFCAQNNADNTIPQCNSQFPNPVAPFLDVSGRPTDYAPKWSGSVTASYSIRLPGDYKFTAEVSPYLTKGYFLGGSPDPVYYIGGYGRLDARWTLEKPDGHWAIDLIGKNLTDHVIVTSKNLHFAAKEQPRNVAAQIRYRF